MTKLAHTGGGTIADSDFANEKDGGDGRVFGITEESDTRALPRLGLSTRANAVPAPDETDTTMVVDQGDSPGDRSRDSIDAGR